MCCREGNKDRHLWDLCDLLMKRAFVTWYMALVPRGGIVNEAFLAMIPRASILLISLVLLDSTTLFWFIGRLPQIEYREMNSKSVCRSNGVTFNIVLTYTLRSHSSRVVYDIFPCYYNIRYRLKDLYRVGYLLRSYPLPNFI